MGGRGNPRSPVYRLQQLNLPDDPAFLPDLDMNLDLSMFGISTGSSSGLGSITPPSCLSSRSSVAREPMTEPALVFPSVETPRGELGEFGFGGDTNSAFKTASRAGGVSVFEDTGMIEDPGFEFDAEGNVVELPEAGGRENAVPSAPGPVSKLGSDSAISAQVQREHEAGLYGAQVCLKAPQSRLISDFERSSIRTSHSMILHQSSETMSCHCLTHRHSRLFRMPLPPLLSKHLNPKRRCLPQQKHINIESELPRSLKPTGHKN